MAYYTRGARFDGGQTGFSAGNPMTDDDLFKVAPSIFATDAHESRSERFTYIPTFEVLAGLRKEGFVPVRAIQGNSRLPGKAEFTKHMIRLQHPDYGVSKHVAGTVPEVVLLNAHDGTAAYRMLSGVFRGICTNSQIVMEDGATDIRVPHKGDVLGKVIEGSFTVIGESRNTLERVDQWQGLVLSDDERLALAESAHVLRFGDAEGNVTTGVEPVQLLIPRRSEDRSSNLWLTHNVLQENMIRGGISAVSRDAQGRRRRSTTREVRNIDGDVKLNRALWLLSHRMAELKSGIAA